MHPHVLAHQSVFSLALMVRAPSEKEASPARSLSQLSAGKPGTVGMAMDEVWRSQRAERKRGAPRVEFDFAHSNSGLARARADNSDRVPDTQVTKRSQA